MAFHLTNRWGATHPNPPTEMLRQAIATLDVEDQEHPDISLAHESGLVPLSISQRPPPLGKYRGR